jgi:hypothetical protein
MGVLGAGSSRAAGVCLSAPLPRVRAASHAVMVGHVPVFSEKTTL